MPYGVLLVMTSTSPQEDMALQQSYVVFSPQCDDHPRSGFALIKYLDINPSKDGWHFLRSKSGIRKAKHYEQKRRRSSNPKDRLRS